MVWEGGGGILEGFPHSYPLSRMLPHYCSVTIMTAQDRTIAVWDMKTPKDVVLRRVLVGHRAAVNVVDFDERYIVSASGDRTIKVHMFKCVCVCVCDEW